MLDHFHRRLVSVERAIEKVYAAPTFPIYDYANLPQDAIKGQICIGTDHSINWYDGTWYTQAAGVPTVTNAPQDAVEGQVVITPDNGLAWFSDGVWHGGGGVVATGNPPQDAILGQLAIGNGILCWHNDGSWYTFGGTDTGQLLRLMTTTANYPDGFVYDDYTPALYYVFPSTHTDIWLRFTFRHDLVDGFTQWYLMTLGFTEWTTDQAYYGDWWNTGGFWAFTENNSDRPSFGENNFSNLSGTQTDYGPAPANPTVSTIYDYHAYYTGDAVVSGETVAQWVSEAYRDNVLRRVNTWNIEHDPGKPLFHSINALNINNQYGNTGAAYLYIDDIMVGTTQGGSDIMSTETFDDGTFGQFTLDLGDMSVMKESFRVVPDPAI